MRRLLTLLLLVGFTFASCKKEDTISPIDARLAGQWEMTTVKDNATNVVLSKPASVPENVDIIISFTSSAKGNISGSLTSATSVKGEFSIGQSKVIAIPAINLSYPTGDIFYGSMDWDQQFTNNITLSDSYSFDLSNHLNISCSNNKVLTFVRK